MNLAEIMQDAVDTRNAKLNALREKAEKQRVIDINACNAFLKEIEPLRGYGIKYELRQRQYNVYSDSEEYRYPRFHWEVSLKANFNIMATLICKIAEDGTPLACWMPCPLWSAPNVNGRDKDGYFTAEQFARYWASQIK